MFLSHWNPNLNINSIYSIFCICFHIKNMTSIFNIFFLLVCLRQHPLFLVLNRHEFCYPLVFFPLYHPLCFVTLTPSLIFLSPFFYLRPIIPPSCWLADLNPVLLCSSAVDKTNSVSLCSHTHMLCCPSALTVHEKKTEDRLGVGD